ncbi:MAG: S8 family serine peptidase [Clostridia bacterium]|nr:S8 family serine peptidase [Clostridia bacterium]
MRSIRKLLSKSILVMFILAIFLPQSIPSFATQSKDTKKQDSKEPIKEIIVKFKDKNNSASVKNLAKNKDNKVLSSLKFIDKKKLSGIETVNVGDRDINEVIKELRQYPEVEFAEPNYKLYASSVPSDVLFPQLWGLKNDGQAIEGQSGSRGVDINALKAWEMSDGRNDLVIGIIDTGIDTNHPDLKDNIYVNPGETAGNGIDDDGNGFVDDVHGWDFYHDDGTVYDTDYESYDNHGTHVAGTIAASKNNIGVVGVAPNVKVMSLKFLGRFGGETSDAIEAIAYAKKMGVKIVNCSWGGFGYSQALEISIRDSGILFVCSAGNDSHHLGIVPQYPVGYKVPNILSVAAIDNTGRIATFSNFGDDVDVAAPGVDILSTLPDNQYDYYSGTSMAAPHVTGIAALLKSYNPNLDYLQIKDRIKKSAAFSDFLVGKVSDSGMVDAYAALQSTIEMGVKSYLDNNTVTLTWESVSGAAGYQIEIDGVLTGVITGSSFTDILPSNSTRIYRIIAVGAGGTIGCSKAILKTNIPMADDGTGLSGKYCADTAAQDPKLVRTDKTVNFDWGASSPESSIGNEKFSVVWTGKVAPLYSDTYTFHTFVDGGVRLWVNGKLLIDKLIDQDPIEYNGSIYLKAGYKYYIQMEYFKNSGTNASAKLYWSRPGEEKSVIPTARLYPSIGEGKWAIKKNIPQPLYGHATVALNDKVLVMGGNISYNDLTDSILEYDPVADTWTDKARMTSPRTYFQAVNFNGKIYVFGGEGPNFETERFLNIVEEYDPASGRWTRKADMPTKRSQMSVAAANGKIYVFGGATSINGKVECISTVEEYDPATDRWTTKSSMSVPRDCLGTLEIKGKIYAFGGYKQSGWLFEYLDTVEQYDPTTNMWMPRANMPFKMCGFGSGVINGKIYTVGGGDGQTMWPSNKEVLEYDPEIDKWSVFKDSTPISRVRLGSAVINGKIYAIGGLTYYLLDTVQEYTPESASNKAVIYEAESAALSSGAKVNDDHSNFSGTGFVDGYWNSGASTAFTFKAAKSGYYDTTLRYANATESSKTVSIYINGVKTRNTTLHNLTNWDTWGYKTDKLALNQGINTVMFKFDSGDGGNINLDNIVVKESRPEVYEAENAVLSGGASVGANHTGYSGAGFVDGYWNAGAATSFTVNVPESDNYDVALRFANATDNFKTVSIYVNGTKVKQTRLARLVDWDTWSVIAQ